MPMVKPRRSRQMRISVASFTTTTRTGAPPLPLLAVLRLRQVPISDASVVGGVVSTLSASNVRDAYDDPSFDKKWDQASLPAYCTQ